MAKRDVQLDIKVNGTDQINNVNEELAQTSVNAEKVADSALKLTKGIAGGFELAAQAAGVFGEETGAAFEKTVQRATEYIALSNALKDVAEGFSKENIKGLTAIFQGFTKAGIGARLFGTVTASAITATGIGALVVALGLLVANWDAVTEAVGGFIDSIPFLKSIKDTVNELIERVGSLGNLFQAVGSYVVALFTDGANAADAFNKSLEEGKAAEALDETLKAQEKINKELDRSIELLKAQGGEEQKIFDLRRQNLNDNIRLLDQKNNKSQEEIDKLEDYRQKLKLLDIEEKKFRQNQIKASNEATAKRKEEADKRNAEAKRILDEQTKIEQQAADEIEQLRINAIENQQEREIQQLIFDYAKRIRTVVGNEKQISQITEALINERNRKIKAINDKFIVEENKNKDKQISDELNRYVKFIDNFIKETEDIALFDEVLIGDEFQRKGDVIVNYINAIKDKLTSIGDEDLSNKILEDVNRFIAEYNRLVETDVAPLFSEKWREKNAENFQLISDYAAVGADAINQVYDVLIERQQQQLEGLQLQFQLIDSQYTEAVNNRRALEEELLTAQGARREEILNSLKEEGAAERKLAAEKEKIAKKQIDIQNKINQQEYINSVIQATITAAQAVLRALATVPPASFALAAVTAALSAVQVGIVAANKPKPINYATGGFTEGVGYRDQTGHEVAGVVHANEYVVPAKVLNTESGYRMVAALEAMRQGKPTFADGGATTPTISTPETASGMESLMAALQGLNLQVAVTEVNTVQSRVRVIEDKASI